MMKPALLEYGARDPLLRRSFRARRWLAHAQVGVGLGRPWLAAGDPGSPPVLARTWHVSLLQASWLLVQLILGKVPESRPQHHGAGSLPAATVYEHTFDLSRASRNVRGCATGRGEIDEYRTDSHHQ